MMHGAIISGAILVGMLCAAVMGHAIQRGGTCMVAAVEEMVRDRRVTRLTAMGEAGLWVVLGLLLARAAGHLPVAPAAYPVGIGTVLGGALLGLGAFANGACVLGSIARLGSGKWAYCATPLGYFAGCLPLGFILAAPPPAGAGSPLPGGGVLVILAFPLTVYGLWRGRSALRAVRAGMVKAHVWAPHQATMVIGIAFVVMMLILGNWSYTQVLADAAHGMFAGQSVRLALFAALLAGAIHGGWTAGTLGPALPRARDLARCFAGGVLMGAGSMLAPGGNDGLVLLGLPLLLPYAWVAIASMVAALLIALLIAAQWPATGQRQT
eukprot:gene5644-5705_t